MLKQKFFNYRVVLFALTFILTSGAWADMMVHSLQGSPDAIQVTKDGKPIQISALSSLTGGEVISITAEDAAAILIDNEGRDVRVDKNNSPYTVATTNSGGLIDNLLSFYNSFGEDDVVAVPTISRGGDDIPISLLGMDRNENLVPEDIQELKFLWAGGSGAYQVNLVSEDGKILLNDKADIGQANYSGKELGEGAYQFVVEDTGEGVNEIDKQIFQVVSTDLLPQEVKNLRKGTLQETARNQVTAMMLAQYAEWRFAALQYALASGDDRLVKALLSGSKPGK
jgi:hypothetical protein